MGTSNFKYVSNTFTEGELIIKIRQLGYYYELPYSLLNFATKRELSRQGFSKKSINFQSK